MAVIGVDIDGVLADFNTAYIKLVRAHTGRDLFPAGYHPGIIETWSYPETFGYTNEEISAVWKWIGQDNRFWLDLQPLLETKGFLDALQHSTHDVYFITSRIGGQVKFQTEEWLARQYFEDPTVLISSEKGLCCKALNITHYIDDKNENCQDVAEKSPKTACYMLVQPWNQPQMGVPRIHTLQEFLNAIE